MKRLVIKLTALLLPVLLLLPLTSCSSVDFSEQINDVYMYKPDFEITVRMPRYYKASEIDPNAPLDIEVELRYTGGYFEDEESIEIGHNGSFSKALLYYGDEKEPVLPYTFTQELHQQTLYKDQPLVEKWDASNEVGRLGPLKPGKYRVKIYWDFSYTDTSHDTVETISNYAFVHFWIV